MQKDPEHRREAEGREMVWPRGRQQRVVERGRREERMGQLKCQDCLFCNQGRKIRTTALWLWKDPRRKPSLQPPPCPAPSQVLP